MPGHHLTGSSGYFSADGDLKDSGEHGTRRAIRRLEPRGHVDRDRQNPVIAAVEGGAFGVGLSLATAADYVVAADDPRFSCTFVKIGIRCDGGAAWSLPRRVGVPRALRMLMTGQAVCAADAEDWGLVGEICGPGGALEAASRYAHDLSAWAAAGAGRVEKAVIEGGAVASSGAGRREDGRAGATHEIRRWSRRKAGLQGTHTTFHGS